MKATARFPSIGCELQPAILGDLPALRARGILDHVQVTIPNTILFQDALAASTGSEVIAHSNLLNTLGEVDWDELAPILPQIRSLSPVHIVEHFTAFRPSPTEKAGIHFDLEMLRPVRKQRVVDTIRRWRDMTRVPVCLENVPVASDVRAYFDFLLEVSERADCGIACDLPHFFLSVFSARFTKSEIALLAAELDPVQLHAGGLSEREGVLRDNHKAFSPWIASQGRSLFPSVKYVTLEQNHQLPLAVVQDALDELCRNNPSNKIPAELMTGQGLSQAAANLELARETARSNGFPIPAKAFCQTPREAGAPRSSVRLYDKYLPFLNPIDAIESEMDRMTPPEALTAVALLGRWSLAYLSWWHPSAPGKARISFGQGDQRLHQSWITASGVSADTSEYPGFFEQACWSHRLASARGFWVEVAGPEIPSNHRDEIGG